MNIVKSSNKISTLINLQNNTHVISRHVWILLKAVIKYLHWSICKTIHMLYHDRAATCSACISHKQCVGYRALQSYYIWILFIGNKISTLIDLQNNTDIISRYDCNGNTHVHHVDTMYLHKFTGLFKDRININFMDISFLRSYQSAGYIDSA